MLRRRAGLEDLDAVLFLSRILNASAGTWTLKRIREGRHRLSVVPLGPVRADVGAALILQTETVRGWLSFL